MFTRSGKSLNVNQLSISIQACKRKRKHQESIIPITTTIVSNTTSVVIDPFEIIQDLSYAQLKQFSCKLLKQLAIKQTTPEDLSTLVVHVKQQLQPAVTLSALKDLFVSIHTFLSTRSRIKLFQICKAWNKANQQPILWRTFTIYYPTRVSSRQYGKDYLPAVCNEMPLSFMTTYAACFNQLRILQLNPITKSMIQYFKTAPLPPIEQLILCAETSRLFCTAYFPFVRRLIASLTHLTVLILQPNVSLVVPSWWSTQLFPRLVYYCCENSGNLLPGPTNAPELQTLEMRSSVTKRTSIERYSKLEYLEVTYFSTIFPPWQQGIISTTTTTVADRVLKCFSMMHLNHCRELIQQIGMLNAVTLRLALQFPSFLMPPRLSIELNAVRSSSYVNAHVKRVEIILNCAITRLIREMLKAMLELWFPQLQELIFYVSRRFPFNSATMNTLVRYCKRLRLAPSNLVISWHSSSQLIPFKQLAQHTSSL